MVAMRALRDSNITVSWNMLTDNYQLIVIVKIGRQNGIHVTVSLFALLLADRA
jgi:hypothetical protein